MNNLKDISIGMFTGLLLSIFIFAMITEAKTTGIMSMDEEGRIYSTQTGYFTVHGKTYYAHKTKSHMYKRGELLTNGYRVRNGKMYYFGPDGAMVTRKTSRDRSTRYIDFNRDGSVHYIYPAGRRTKKERYNANHRRYQVKKHGKWRDAGMQVWPVGMIDWQW
jgi:hypothetical protein